MKKHTCFSKQVHRHAPGRPRESCHIKHLLSSPKFSPLLLRCHAVLRMHTLAIQGRYCLLPWDSWLHLTVYPLVSRERTPLSSCIPFCDSQFFSNLIKGFISHTDRGQATSSGIAEGCQHHSFLKHNFL